MLAGKVRALKKELKMWNDEEFGKIDDQRKILFEELACLDEKEIVGVLTDEAKARKIVVVADLEKT